MPKYFGLLKEVGHIAKWGVFTEITFFGSIFFRSVIRAHTGSFANVSAGTSPLYIKVGQILWLSKNGWWDLVDMCRFFFPKYLVIWPVFPRKNKKKVSGAFYTPNIKVGQMCDIWKNRSWSAVDACTSFFLFFSQFDLFFPGKVIKIGVFAHFSPIYKSRSNFGVVKNGSWVLVDAHRFSFYGSWIRACTGSFGDVPKYFGLLKEVAHIAKWGVFTEITFFGSNFFRSVIRAQTGSFATVPAGTSPLYIKVGQISWLSKNGSWDLVDAHRFFFQISCYLTCFPQKK